MPYPKFKQFEPNKRYTVKCIKCYDGDTITVEGHLLNDPKLPIYTWPCRLYGIDCPEMKPSNSGSEKEEKEEEKLAAKYDKQLLESLILNKTVELEGCVDDDKYGRSLVNVYINNKNINEILIKEGNSVAYNGGAKLEWSRRVLIKKIKK